MDKLQLQPIIRLLHQQLHAPFLANTALCFAKVRYHLISQNSYMSCEDKLIFPIVTVLLAYLKLELSLSPILPFFSLIQKKYSKLKNAVELYSFFI